MASSSCLDRGPGGGVASAPGAPLDERHEPDPSEPGNRLPQLVLGHREQEVAPDVVQPEVVERLQDRQEADAVARQLRVRRPEDERLVSLVGAVVEERRGLGIGPGDDDARHPHDVELQARGIEPLVLLVLADQDLAALMAALLGARLLVLDVIARARPTSTNRRIRFRTCASPPWPVSASAMMNGRKSTSGVDRRVSSSIWVRAKCWFLSAVRSARTKPAASSGTWLRG